MPWIEQTCLIRGLHFAYGGLIFAIGRWSASQISRAWGKGRLRYYFEDHTLDTDRRELREARLDPPRTTGVRPASVPDPQQGPRDQQRRHHQRNLEGRVVSDAALTTRLNAARTAVGDTGEKQHLIKTLPRKGFRFVGAVHEDQGRPNTTAQGNAGTPPVASAPRLSIVVLPSQILAVIPNKSISPMA